MNYWKVDRHPGTITTSKAGTQPASWKSTDVASSQPHAQPQEQHLPWLYCNQFFTAFPRLLTQVCIPGYCKLSLPVYKCLLNLFNLIVFSQSLLFPIFCLLRNWGRLSWGVSRISHRLILPLVVLCSLERSSAFPTVGSSGLTSRKVDFFSLWKERCGELDYTLGGRMSFTWLSSPIAMLVATGIRYSEPAIH